MPVILGPGFGAVIFHEACGHAMEAAATANNQSVLAGKIGEKIASDKVTIIDDGTIDNLWGTSNIDDEGELTRKNILIENGVLVNYLNEGHVRNLICMPTTGYKIGDEIINGNVNIYKVEMLSDAVKLAKEITNKNSICLMSPAAASYEYFKNFQEKGEAFKKLVKND